MKVVSFGVRGHFPRFRHVIAMSPVHGFRSPRAESMADSEEGDKFEYSH